MLKTTSALSLVAILASCGGAPAANELRTDRDGNVVTGVAGPDWADNELNIACRPGENITNLNVVRDTNGIATFSGNCVPAL